MCVCCVNHAIIIFQRPSSSSKPDIIFGPALFLTTGFYYYSPIPPVMLFPGPVILFDAPILIRGYLLLLFPSILR